MRHRRRHRELRRAVLEANRLLPATGLVPLTWGNVSQVDREAGVFAIKPSGVPYSELTVRDIVVLDFELCAVEGRLRPSSDAPAHAELYARLTSIGGVCHTHSKFATAFAQARSALPCCGTTHADAFHGTVPLARPLTPGEVADCYEVNTGLVLAETLAELGLDPLEMPGALAAGHGPFTWGPDARAAVENAVTLESVAEMAFLTRAIAGEMRTLESYVLEKHYARKHGAKAYYGQRD
jgi:L-ribulose-5-phosphate 4-epimerase